MYVFVAVVVVFQSGAKFRCCHQRNCSMVKHSFDSMV